ncbi:MAG: phospholipase [Spirochaetaceae bacterium]|nr:MAG: phospholipase [Spirochaetaceae bacterium]
MKPHSDQPALTAGAPVDQAKAAMVMIHGRGGNAADILSLHAAFGVPDVAYRAPQAAENSWYPLSFLSPIRKNEPGLSSALWVIGRIVDSLVADGIAHERIMLLGFSQGACLALEFAARHPRRYGAVFGLSGGLIGPDASDWKHHGSLAETPVFLGCSDIDFHIPKTRVQESSELFRRLGASVTERLYPGMPHTINQDEVDFTIATMQQVIGAGE